MTTSNDKLKIGLDARTKEISEAVARIDTMSVWEKLYWFFIVLAYVVVTFCALLSLVNIAISLLFMYWWGFSNFLWSLGISGGLWGFVYFFIAYPPKEESDNAR